MKNLLINEIINFPRKKKWSDFLKMWNFSTKNIDKKHWYVRKLKRTIKLTRAGALRQTYFLIWPYYLMLKLERLLISGCAPPLDIQGASSRVMTTDMGVDFFFRIFRWTLGFRSKLWTIQQDKRCVYGLRYGSWYWNWMANVI